MNFKENVKKRSDKIQKFVKGNFISVIVSVIAIVVIVSSGFFNINSEKKNNTVNENSIAEEQAEKKVSHFKIYTSDYVVLFGSIAFCTVMIIRRNHKSKEEI